MITTIALLELSSIASGFETEDAMLKAGAVDLILARTICSGKYLIIVSGDVDAVKASIAAGKQTGTGYIVDELVIPHVHPSIFPALTASVDLPPERRDALGIVETFSAASAISGADVACKTADIVLFRLHLAMAIGGKGYFCFTGDVASVRAAVDAAVDSVSQTGLLAGKSIIPRPRQDLFKEIL
ncbi:BMC domain-containing protein [bacterium]|nr:BMC domain-containing protein [candidate division CSSED10-310 bacterium]